MLGLALGLALTAVPALEGWWRPEGPDPHPSALAASTRARVAVAAVSFGADRSGTFVSRDGLILTSATAIAECARRLRAQGRVGPGPFVADDPSDAPVCPKLRARVRLDSRDVRGAVEAARRAGSTDVESALIGACRRLGTDRRCELVATEDGAHRLIVRQLIRQVRLRFYPGPTLGQLGGAAHAFDPPWLRLDAALVSVDLGRTGAAGHLRVAARTPGDVGDEVWMVHHPSPSLRWASALDVELFVQQVLPAYLARARLGGDRTARRRAFLQGLVQLGPEAEVLAQRRELEVLERVRGLAPSRRAALTKAFVQGRDAMRSTAWGAAARAGLDEPSPPLLEALVVGVAEGGGEARPAPGWAESARPFTSSAELRRRARMIASRPAIGPDGRRDLRISRGQLASAAPADGWRIPWGTLLEAARRLDVDLGLPAPLPWADSLAVGFEVRGDIGPLATGGPVLDAHGDVVGVISSGDRRTAFGLFAHDPRARLGVTSALALQVALERAFAAPGLARALRR